MKVYVGIDIGTTNSKVILVSIDGNIQSSLSFKTPIVVNSNIAYFDILTIESEIEKHLIELRSRYTILSISITSVGESVVPILNNNVLSLPLVWYEKCTKQIFEKYGDKIGDYAKFGNIGIEHNNSTLSIYKMIWMQEYLDVLNVDYWLPISSYLLYKLGAEPVWAESQACRSCIFDIYNKNWIVELLDFFNIGGQLGEVWYSGTIVGQYEHTIPLVLAGHDHITGLQGMHILNNEAPLIYQSMGTSSVSAIVYKNDESEFRPAKPFLKSDKGIIGAAFCDNTYFIQNSFKYFGYVIDQCFYMKDQNFSISKLDSINNRILDYVKVSQEIVYLMGERDPLFQKYFDGLTFINVPQHSNIELMIYSAYVYLSIASARTNIELSKFFDSSYSCYIGGPMAKNKLLVTFLASAIQHTLSIPQISEITALGSILASMNTIANQGELEILRSKIKILNIEPEKNLIPILSEHREKYQQIINKMNE